MVEGFEALVSALCIYAAVMMVVYWFDSDKSWPERPYWWKALFWWVVLLLGLLAARPLFVKCRLWIRIRRMPAPAQGFAKQAGSEVGAWTLPLLTLLAISGPIAYMDLVTARFVSIDQMEPRARYEMRGKAVLPDGSLVGYEGGYLLDVGGAEIPVSVAGGRSLPLQGQRIIATVYKKPGVEVLREVDRRPEN